jgi:hypothetical protein
MWLEEQLPLQKEKNMHADLLFSKNSQYIKQRNLSVLSICLEYFGSSLSLKALPGFNTSLSKVVAEFYALT